MGLALMSKYYALILVATCFIAALQHPSRRKYFAAASPYVSTLVAAAICAPHVWWLMTNRAPPLHYLAAISDRGWHYALSHAAQTVSGVLGMNLGVVLIVGFVTWIARRDETAAFGCNPRVPILGVLATLALAPLALTVVSGVALRTIVTPEMTIGTFALVPLLAIEIAGTQDIDRLYRISTRLAAAVTLGALALSPAVALARTWASSSAMSVAPFQEVAAEVTKLWHDRTSQPLDYVAGSPWYDNAIAFYSPDRPHAFVLFDYSRNLWVTPEALARHGLLSVCVSDDSFCLTATAKFTTPESTRTELSVAHAFWGHVAEPVNFIVTIIPPRRSE
jgi:hypothetical protein